MVPVEPAKGKGKSAHCITCNGVTLKSQFSVRDAVNQLLGVLFSNLTEHINYQRKA